MAKLSLERAIHLAARKYNLDPRAMMAIAMHESGMRWGAVGDGGSSFGPFQLHRGGAMPADKSAAWANSLQGVMYAARQMSKVGASGLTGYNAIDVISRKFERPADPNAEISHAWDWYRSGKGPAASFTQGGARKGTGAFGPGMIPGRSALMQAAMQANQEFATTGRIDTTFALSVAQNGLTNSDQAQMGNVPAMRGAGFGPMAGGKANKIVGTAAQFLGTPYVWGGTTPKGFDCSGLIQYVYAKHGISIPRTTYEQIKVGRKVAWGQFQPGDLIFSDFLGTGRASHVAMYVGNGKVIVAPRTGDVVKYQDVSAFRKVFKGARRVL